MTACRPLLWSCRKQRASKFGTANRWNLSLESTCTSAQIVFSFHLNLTIYPFVTCCLAISQLNVLHMREACEKQVGNLWKYQSKSQWLYVENGAMSGQIWDDTSTSGIHGFDTLLRLWDNVFCVYWPVRLITTQCGDDVRTELWRLVDTFSEGSFHSMKSSDFE